MYRETFGEFLSVFGGVNIIYCHSAYFEIHNLSSFNFISVYSTGGNF